MQIVTCEFLTFALNVTTGGCAFLLVRFPDFGLAIQGCKLHHCEICRQVLLGMLIFVRMKYEHLCRPIWLQCARDQQADWC